MNTINTVVLIFPNYTIEEIIKVIDDRIYSTEPKLMIADGKRVGL